MRPGPEPRTIVHATPRSSRALRWLASALLLSACSSSSTYVPLAKPQEAPPELQKLMEQDTKLQEQLAKLPEAQQTACDFKVGDCKLFVSERRKDLIYSRYTPDCQHNDQEVEAECELKKLIEAGETEGMDDYFEYKIWCTRQQIACVAELQQLRDNDLKAAEVRMRQENFRDLGYEYRQTLAAQAGQLEYLRATLPPSADGLCQDLPEVARCNQRAEEERARFDEAVATDPDKYDEELTKRSWEQYWTTATSCKKPELECIQKSLPKYGDSGEAATRMKSNLKLLEERAALASNVEETRAESCITSAVAEHQDSIVSTYGKYARNPGPFFRVALHKEFTRLFEDQIRCLKSSAPAAPGG